MQTLINIVDFFIPRLCIICNSRLNNFETLVCDNCISSLITTNDKLLNEEFTRKFSSDSLISDFYSHFIFEKNSELQTIIHSLKYNDKFLVGKMLGKIIAEHAKNKIISWNCDAIIPIPLHPLKKAKRGYNQAYFISKGLSKNLDIPVLTNVIKRIKMTETQTKLNFTERKENMQNAFKPQKVNLVKNKNMILIDDVITTGATIKECAKILKDSGANKVFALSAAIAEHDGDVTSYPEQ